VLQINPKSLVKILANILRSQLKQPVVVQLETSDDVDSGLFDDLQNFHVLSAERRFSANFNFYQVLSVKDIFGALSQILDDGNSSHSGIIVILDSPFVTKLFDLRIAKLLRKTALPIIVVSQDKKFSWPDDVEVHLVKDSEGCWVDISLYKKLFG
jgi:hypothetical protein